MLNRGVLLVRNHLLSQTERVLRKNGFSISKNHTLLSPKTKAVGWRPSLYATKRHNEKLAIEILPDASIPAHLVNTLSLCKNQLRKLQITLWAVVPEGANLSQSLRAASQKFDIHVMEVGRTTFKEILSKQMSEAILKAQPEEIIHFRQERAVGHHIPSALLDLVKRMQHVKLKADLKKFAARYESENFTRTNPDPLTAEYEFVLVFLTSIAARLFGVREAKRIGVGQKVERIRLQVGDYRDHFIHAFQVFLLGMVIIDSYYGWFKRWMRSQHVDHLEETWFLASIFHDIHKPLEKSDWLGESEGVEIGAHFIKWKEMISLLSVTYEKRIHKRTARQLQQILTEHYARVPRNHAILGALDLINIISGVNIKNTPSHVATAAQCVAMHDKKMWKDLADARIMPLSIEEDPIGYLLIYCDAAQEWGRPGKDSDEHVGLMGINIGNEVQCTIFFEDPEAALPKLQECQNMRRYLRHTCLKCSLSVTAV